jgi:hypothetical protein
MYARHRWWALAVLAILAVMVLAACGSADDGGGGGESAEPSTAASAAPSEGTPADSPEPSDAEPSQDGGGGGDFPEVADGNFATGTMRVEIRGGHDTTTDLDASGLPVAGGVFISGGSTAASAQIAWSKAEGNGGVSYTDAEVATAADIVEQCELDISKNDASGLDGVIECKGIEALVNGGLTTATIDLKVEFKMDR